MNNIRLGNIFEADWVAAIREAQPADYASWLLGYLAGGGKPTYLTRIIPGQMYYLTSDIKMKEPPIIDYYTYEHIRLIVPRSVQLLSSNITAPLTAKCTIYYLKDYTCYTNFEVNSKPLPIPIYIKYLYQFGWNYLIQLMAESERTYFIDEIINYLELKDLPRLLTSNDNYFREAAKKRFDELTEDVRGNATKI